MQTHCATKIKVKLATSYFGRALGLLGKSPPSEVVCLCCCKDIHTFGMKHEIDVAFVDNGRKVLKVYRNIKPRQRLRHKEASFVLERFSSDDPWVIEGTKVILEPIAGKGKSSEKKGFRNEDMPNL